MMKILILKMVTLNERSAVMPAKISMSNLQKDERTS